MTQILDPWDAPDVLEEFEARPDFEARWRGFLRDCALLVIPRLSPEFAQIAGQCFAVADAFDNGRADLGALAAMFTELWLFEEVHRVSCPATELAGLVCVAHRLRAGTHGRWHGVAGYVLQILDDSGIPEAQWFPLLLKRFEGFVTGPANPA